VAPSHLISLNTWHVQPLNLGLLLGLSLGYLFFLKRLHHGRSPISPFRIFLYFTGIVLIFLATASPLETLARNYLITARASQHLLLAYLIPPFLWAGFGAGLLNQVVLRYPWLDRLLFVLGQPIPAAIFFNLGLMAWYLPPLCAFSVNNVWGAQLEHLSVLLAGLVMWLPLMHPLHYVRPHFSRQMFYLIILIFCQVPLFGVLTLSREALYLSYQLAPRITQLSAYGDQQSAGWLIKLVSVLVFAGALVAIFLQWHEHQRIQDRNENLQAFENLRLVNLALRRQGAAQPPQG